MPTHTGRRAPTGVKVRKESHCPLSCCKVDLFFFYSSFQLMEKEKWTVNEEKVYFKVNL